MKRKVLIAVLLGAMTVSMVGGCGNKSTSEEDVSVKTEAAEVEEEAEPEETYKAIGTESEEAYAVQLTNDLGQDIKAISVKASSEDAYPDNMLEDADVFAKDETRILYYEAPEAEEETATEDGKLLNPEYSIQLTLADDSVLELHAFPFGDIEEGEIKTQDGVAYITYESVSSKSEVTTLDAELATKAQKEEDEAAKAEAEAAAAAQAETTQDAAEETEETYEDYSYEDYYEDYSYDESEYEAPTYDESESSDDGCVGDGLTY